MNRERSSYYNITIEGEIISSECTLDHCSFYYSNNLAQYIVCNNEYYYGEK